ncbi:uncharacterized protein LOC117102951, partial [Anneissia japonica]|uniref:uncharacterized protein LOC117102951 n=1 Tax=Anneissia japonica TaxID=1529436 RepID=UPI00142581D0
MPVIKPDRMIYLADMQPRYWTDNRFGASWYKTEFSDMAKEGARTQEMKDIKREQNEVSKHNLKDVRKSHFSLGDHQGSFDSETYYSYFMAKPGAGSELRQEDETNPAVLARKMVEDERNSAVFRHGDYNITRALPSISTFNRDFNTIIKPLKAAGFIEPTRSKKGRFLNRAPRQERYTS